jgi:outer membrane receptor protein involved in Fe transport
MQLKYFLAASAASVSLACGLIAAPAAAQQITTGIQGTVNDDQGNPVAGATVTITDTRTGATRTTTTGAEGTFSATNLTTGGPYTVSVSAPNYEGQTLEGIQTNLQGDTSLGFTLTSGQGVIVVTGSRVTVTQLAVGPGQSFTEEVLSTAPSFNRDVRDIIRIDPRVSLDRDDGGSGQDRISCLGGNDRGNTFTVDGLPQSDIYGLNDTGFSSRSSTPIPYDAVRETQVQFAPFDVEYGQFTGCSINVVTKSGSNSYHGGAFFEFTDAGMRADHYENFGVRVPVAPIQPDKRWGAYLGGPIIKDRIFLFGAYEHQESGQSQDEGPSGAGYSTNMAITSAQFDQISAAIKSIYGVDTGPLVHSRPYKNDRYFVRADVQLTEKHRLEVAYQHLEESTEKSDDLFPTGTSQAIVGENTFYLSGTKSNYYTGRLYSDWNDHLSTELRYSHAKIQDLQDPVGGGEAQSANPIPRIVVGLDNPTGSDVVVVAGPGRSRTANDLRTTTEQYRGVVKYDAGEHQIKFGAELNRASVFNLFLQDATGTLIFRNLADLQAGLLSPGTGSNQTSTTAANVISGATEGAFGNFSSTGDVNTAAANFSRENLAVYLQDDWQVTDALSVVAGVRLDTYRGGHPNENPNFYKRYGITNATGFDEIEPVLEPRVGVTYELPNFAVFSRAELHGGVGIFSGGDPLVWFGNAFQNNGQAFGLGTLQSAGCPPPSANFQVKVLDSAGKFTGVPACIKAAGSALGAQGNAANQSVDPDIKMPTVLRANIGFQANLDFAPSGFFSGWKLNLDYIYSKYENPFTVVDLAQAPNITKGLAGFTIDGRPIYSAIDPIAAGCSAKIVSFDPTPGYSGLTAGCFNTSRGADLMLTNAGSFRSHNASVILSKYSNHGIFTQGGSTFISLGYAYSDAHDRRNMYNSTAGSNYGITAAFDRQNPAESAGFYQSKHNISVGMNWAEALFSDLKTSLGVTFVARGGRPYSLTFTGNNVFNTTQQGLTTADTALAYLPTGLTDPNVSPSSTITAQQMTDLVTFINSHDCAKQYIGHSIPRNTCTNDWYYDMDVTLSQELPGPGHFFGLTEDKIKIFATVDNFLNLLNPGGNLQRRRSFMGVQDIAGLTTAGVDAQGRYIFANSSGLATFDSDNQVNVSSSIWRLKVGISYNF